MLAEWGRRLRVRSTQPDLRGSRETPPGPTTWVRPATGWWGRMNAGESPRNQGRSVWAPLSVSRRRSRGLRKTPQWSAARRTPYVIGRAPQGVEMLPAPFGAPLPSPLVREHFPLVREGMEIPGAPRALREQGRRSFGFFAGWLAGCLKCESDVRARSRHSIPHRLRGGWPSGGDSRARSGGD